MTAFQLCGNYDDEKFRVKKGGKVVWECISYSSRCDKCRVSRVVYSDEGGKPLLMGLNYKVSYLNPDTEIEIMERPNQIN